MYIYIYIYIYILHATVTMQIVSCYYYLKLLLHRWWVNISYLAHSIMVFVSVTECVVGIFMQTVPTQGIACFNYYYNERSFVILYIKPYAI